MSYRRLITRRTAAWAVVSSTSRLPNAMAPLAMVFLGHGSAGGYSTGTVLAACYIVGEVAGASLLGTLVHPHRVRLNIAVGLAVSAVAFGYLAMLPDSSLPLLGAAAFIAGGAPALSPGGLRTILTDIVDEADVPRAFSADAALQELLWLAAPGLVVILALQITGSAPMALCALCLAASSLSTLLLRSVRSEDDTGAVTRPGIGVLASAWPIYLTSAAAMSLLAVAELVLPALLQYRGHPVGAAGVLLMAFAAVSAVFAFCFGLRTWPGGPREQSLIFLILTAASITAVALSPSLVGIAIALLLAGGFQSIVLITRNLSLRARLPADAHTAGYSIQYAVQGVGYASSAIFAAVVLDHSTPRAAVLAGVAMTVVLAVVSAAAERRTRPAASSQAEQAVMP